MSAAILTNIVDALPQFDGYVYPNERTLHPLWSVLIVVYPYITGLVAGAFIMASLVRVFNVKALTPIYRLALLTALAFLICAPLPLLFHLGHPERSYQVMITPHTSSPMAMFGFVYAWYMMAVLLLELWCEYRRDLVVWSERGRGLKCALYRVMTLGVRDLSPAALHLDERMSRIITVIGIPSAFLLHGYVGFIFGSIKANPWWGNVLMPVIFIFSAVVSGIALCFVLYKELCWFRRRAPDDACLDEMGKFLFYALLVDFTVEGLDWLHRLYAAEESISVLKQLAGGRLFNTLLVIQLCLGTLLPLVALGATQIVPHRIPVWFRQRLYYNSAVLILVGVLAMRWNVVIGGQLFSKSLRGFSTFKLGLAGQEGWLLSAGLIFLPFVLLAVFVWLFLPDRPSGPGVKETVAAPAAS
jgi:Ni/Fe-hydrogenase subunit HybB-like protein